ncbi:AraC family transcriptional regulator [Sulfurimonas diazotrophicus]|uniref:AraC family transcriptional regulator n=1 Tax=Sulfurimonas diazotrophicus TaxID=3131939 RepID=A0ABZ3H6S1_9BACT
MQTISPEALRTIRSLVGDVTEEQLRFVDAYVSPEFCAFIPVGGQCGYAVTPEHEHPAYMFVIQYDEATQVVLEGRRLTPKPRHLFCLSPRIAHHEVQNYLPPRYCAIFVNPGSFESVYGQYRDDPVAFNGEMFDLDEGIQPLLQLFMQSCREQARPLAASLAQSLTHLIVRNTLSTFPAERESVSLQGRINAAVEYIHLHYAYELEQRTLAEVAGVSVSHFGRLFRSALGMSAGDYLLRVRLQHVKKVLESGKTSVTDAALGAGFNSASYMARRFKAAFGETPSEYASRFK